MNIIVLTHVDSEDGKPDIVVPQVIAALRSKGHRATHLDVGADAVLLASRLRELRPELVFNLAEGFEGDDWGDAPIAALLHLLGLTFTGSGPRTLYVTQDKVLTRKLLAYEGIRTPGFAVFTRSDGLETAGRLRMPLFVKPLASDASIGIDAKKSLVTDVTGLLERVALIHEEIGDAALAEEYIEGREFYVGVIGDRELVALPVVEMDFSKLPEGATKVADFAAKWEEGSDEYAGTRSILPDLPDALRAQLQDVAVKTCRALGLRDYARVDMRVSESGDVHVLEANANPYLEKGSELARAAAAHGVAYEDLVERIVALALERAKRLGPHDE